MSFPEQLKKARLDKDYTQKQVAALIGVANSTYNGYETGWRQPDIDIIRSLANILGTSADILLETNFGQDQPSNGMSEFKTRR